MERIRNPLLIRTLETLTGEKVVDFRRSCDPPGFCDPREFVKWNEVGKIVHRKLRDDQQHIFVMFHAQNPNLRCKGVRMKVYWGGQFGPTCHVLCIHLCYPDRPPRLIPIVLSETTRARTPCLCYFHCSIPPVTQCGQSGACVGIYTGRNKCHDPLSLHRPVANPLIDSRVLGWTSQTISTTV